MLEQVWHTPDIYRIIVPLPDNPLKYLNSYVIRTAGQALVIDTGFNRPECRQALWEGLEELGLDLTKTALFLTHFHADHSGLVWDFVDRGVPVYMGLPDWEYYSAVTGSMASEQASAFRREGFPQEQLALQKGNNQARLYSAAPGYPVTALEDGQEFRMGGLTLRAVCTPGHTPGHTVLYLPQEELLFSGDHILFDITPNITSWPRVPRSLSDYIDSLQKVRRLSVRAAFPGHREAGKDVYARIDELIEHHGCRLNEIYQTLRACPGLTAYETAGRIHWSARGRDWEHFPPHQRWFAMGETLAHLYYLADKGQVVRDESGDMIRYYPAGYLPVKRK